VQFLAPFMLVGLLGAAVPLVIHLTGRRRAPVKRFGAIDFLLGSNRRVARRLRLREAILLAMRVISCAALALVMTKPFVSCSSGAVSVARGPQAVVLVVDDSFVMGYSVEGESLLSRARTAARQVISELGPEAEIAVVTTTALTGREELSRDHLRLRDQLDALRPSARAPDTSAALARAAALLDTSSQTQRTVYLFSALSQVGFTPGQPAWRGGGPRFYAVPIGPDELPNLAVVSVAAERHPELGPRGVEVAAEIANYGPARVEGRVVSLRVAGKEVARGLVSLAAGEKATKRFAATLPEGSRAVEVVVELDGDALALDDRRYLSVELRRDVRILLVDGDPRTVHHDDETFYLEKALRPGDRDDSAIRIVTSTVDELSRRRLADYDVVFLCNVPPLDPSWVAELSSWVQRGGGLFVSVGDHVDADAYNAAMAPLLAQELRTPRQLAASPKEPEARVERMGRIEAKHPIFSIFSEKAAGLREASFWKIYLLGPTSSAEGKETLARFTNGAPALVLARRGQGRLLLFTSSLDRDWNDLPIQIGYLPFVQQSARFLARAPVSEPDAEVVVGRAREVPIAGDDVRLDVTNPSGKRTTFDGPRLLGRTQVTFGETEEPGFYRVVSTTSLGRQRPSSPFAVNLDARGSDTRRVAPADLPPTGDPAEVPGSTAKRRIELWHGIAAALLLFLLGEAILTRRG
jgi:Aerotolerance regulator N-terminal/von Willebrand factor type A domain